MCDSTMAGARAGLGRRALEAVSWEVRVRIWACRFSICVIRRREAGLDGGAGNVGDGDVV
jgi:hypothetical protein